MEGLSKQPMPISTQNGLLATFIRRGTGSSIGTGTYGLGSSDGAATTAIFPGSPSHDGTYTDEQVAATFVAMNPSSLDDGGDTFGVVDLTYSLAPDKNDTIALISGDIPSGSDPATPWSPNPATAEESAPGQFSASDIPSIDPSTIKVGGGGYGNEVPGTGGAVSASPSTTRLAIKTRRLGNLITPWPST